MINKKQITFISNFLLYLFLLLVFNYSIIFKNGYTVLNSLTGYSNLLMKSLNYPLGFNLIFGYFSSTTWIFQFFMLLPNYLFNDPLIAIRFDVILIFAEYYIASYLLSKLFYKTFSHENTVPLKFSIIFIILMFINYDFMYLFTGQMLPGVFGIPIFLYILIKSYRIYNGDDVKLKDYTKLSLAIMFISLGDPRFFIWAIIAFLGLIVYSIIIRKNVIKSLKILFYPIMIAMPIIIFIYFVWAMGSFSFIYVSPRPLTYQEINFFTKSVPLYSYFQLLGMYWPAFIYSPPSILIFKGDLDSLITVGSPPIMIYPYDIIGIFWYIFTFSWFVLGIISMIFVARKNERAHIAGFIILFILTIGTYFPIAAFVNFYISLERLPVIGGIWGITDAIPNFFMWVIYTYIIFYILLLILKFNEIDKKIESENNDLKFFKKNLKYILNKKILIFIILFILIFPNWQFFGETYPGQYSPVIQGNGISKMGPLQPSNMPGNVQDLYNYFSENYDGSYNIVWPQAWGFTYKWSPRVTAWYQPGNSPPSNFYSYLNEIVQKNEKYLLKPLMDIYGVRYFVIDNTSYINKNPLVPSVTNTQMVNFFENSSGIKLFINDSPDIWVFEDPNASVLNGYSQIYSIGNFSPLDVQYYFSSILNETPLLIENSTPNLYINNPNIENKNGIFSYNYFSNLNKNSSLIENYFEYSYMKGIYYLGSNWYFESLKGNGTLTISNGTAVLNSVEFNLASLSYGNFLSPGHTAIPIPYGYGVNITVSYDFSGNNNSVVSTGLWVTDQNYTKHGGWYFSGNSFKGSGMFRHVSLSTTIPPGLSYFEVQINSNFNGTVILKNINISYSFFKSFKTNYTLEKNIHLMKYKKYMFSIIYTGNGTLTVNSYKYYLSSPFKISRLQIETLTNNSVINIRVENLSIGGLIVSPYNNSVLGNARIYYKNFEYPPAQINFVNNGSKYLAVATENYDWQVNEGKFIGFDAFNREIFYINGSSNNYLYVKNVFFTNIIEIIFLISFYSIFVYIFIPENILKYIKNNLIRKINHNK